MASIGLHDVYHHIYNFGNVSMFLSMGAPEKSVVMEKGEAKSKKILPIGGVVDERVCSGAHYARFFNDFKKYLENPALLELEPEEVKFDNGIEYHVPKPVKNSDKEK